MKHVIIGNSAAAVGAVDGIRLLDQHCTITIVTDEMYHTYARPLISYFLSGNVSAENMKYRPQDFYKKNHVNVLFGTKVTKIDTVNKEVVLSGGGTLAYDNLLIATGSTSTELSIPGITKQNVFQFYTFADSVTLREYIQPGMKGVVLGAGLTALKAAEALVTMGVDTTLVVRSRILRNFLDQGAAAILQKHLLKSGLKLVIGSEPVEIKGAACAETVVLANGSTLPCNFVISAVGILPNTALVAESEVQVDHGILVDEGMRTSVAGVYAAGDVAQGSDLLWGCKRVISLLPVAFAQGEAAGRNMAGGKAFYVGMSMNAVSFFGLPIISAGIIHAKSGHEVHLTDQPDNRYRKLIFHGEQLIGYVLVEQIDRAGILTWLIREQIDTTPFKQYLLDGSFNYAHLPAGIRQKKLSVAR